MMLSVAAKRLPSTGRPAAQRAFNTAASRSPSANQITGAATRTPPTPYERLTLIPAQANDEEQFQTVDLKTVRYYWDKVFLGNTASESVYKAIAAKGGTADVEAQRETVSIYYCYI